MRVGIVAPLAAEARAVAGVVPAPGVPLPLAHGALLVLSGMGAARAQRAARTLLDAGAGALVSWGTAGGLHGGAVPGTLVLPRTVIGAAGGTYPVDPVWHQLLLQQLQSLRPLAGAVAESAAVAAVPAAKAALHARTGADAVDMESAALAVIAAENGVPLLVVRAVADGADARLPARLLGAVDAYGRARTLPLLRCLLAGLGEVRALLPAALAFRRACRALAAAARIGQRELLAPRLPGVPGGPRSPSGSWAADAGTSGTGEEAAEEVSR
jgi:adenosylhomocysteine nucleosidase